MEKYNTIHSTYVRNKVMEKTLLPTQYYHLSNSYVHLNTRIYLNLLFRYFNLVKKYCFSL